jgi:hypothetical protein
MTSRDLLIRLTIAMGAVALGAPFVACDGDTTPVGAAGSSGAESCLPALPISTASGSAQPVCRSNADCDGNPGVHCFAPDEPRGCGAPGGASPPTCTTDADCVEQGDETLCQPRDDLHVRWCLSACVGDGECGPAQHCNETGHCVDRPCGDGQEACPSGSFCTAAGLCAYQNCNADRPCAAGQTCDGETFVCAPTPCTAVGTAGGECPSTFTCAEEPGAAGPLCRRTACECDSACGSGGLCIQGHCFDSPGTCSQLVACGRPLLLDDGLRIAALRRLGHGASW